MKVVKAEFIKSVFTLDALPCAGLPEVAFSGRSNVGKSSLINSLLNRKSLAKTSSTPGRTQSINFMDVNGLLYFVDLPGYGYAKVPLAVKKKWQHLIEGYLQNRKSLRLVVLIVDARRAPGADEARFVEWLNLQGIACAAVVTKIDKLKRSQRGNSLKSWQAFLTLEKVFPFSAISGEGKDKIWGEIDCRVGNNKT